MLNWDEIKFGMEKGQSVYLGLDAASIKSVKVPEKFSMLRAALISDRDKVYDKHYFDVMERLGYSFDLTFGIEMYATLNDRFGFTIRDASNDDIWRFIQLEIIPDIVFSRWDWNEDRFYKNTRRIWLKTIWWYIHLSWAGDKEETYKLLKKNTTDTIMQLVERPGLGYNINLYRELMKQYAGIDDGTNKSRMVFRRVLILNTARLATTVPELYPGGIRGYIANLYADISKEQ